MNGTLRKKICTVLAAAALLAAALTGATLLRGYAHTVPIIAGPYKKAAFLIFALVFAVSAGFYFRPVTRQTVIGTLGTVFGVLWFTCRMLLPYRDPGSLMAARMDQWMPVPLMLFGGGIVLWAGAFLPEDRAEIPAVRKLIPALLLMFIVLQTSLNGSFNWDDAFFSVEAQAMRVSGTPILPRVRQEITEYIKIGRINPFATFHLLLFYLIPDAFAYKLLLMLLTLLSGYLFYRFLRLWGMDDRPALTALLIVPLCFQLRLYHDPLNSYYGLMQVMFCELTGSLILFIRRMREGKKSSLVFSLILFTMGLMSYEMFFPLTVLFLIPALDQEKKPAAALRRVLPYILTAVILFGPSMLLRTNITEETAYSGTTFGLDIPAILRTLGCQLGAAFPLSYRIAGNDAALFGKMIPWNSIFNTSVSSFISSIRWQDLIGCAVLLVLINGHIREERKFSGYRALFGLLLWVLPALVISLSRKYQEELLPGKAYIPVFFSYFGAALLISECAALFGRAVSPKAIRLFLSGAGCALFLLGMQDDRRINDMLNQIFFYPRRAGEAALQAGILGETGDDSLVISGRPFSLWEHGWQKEPYQSAFYSLNSRHPVSAEGMADFIAGQDPDANWVTPKNTTLITYDGDGHTVFAKSGRLRGGGIDAGTGSLKYPMVSDVFIFAGGGIPAGTVLIYRTRDEEIVRLPLADAWLIRETDQGRLYKLQENVPVRFDSIGLLYQGLP